MTQSTEFHSPGARSNSVTSDGSVSASIADQRCVGSDAFAHHFQVNLVGAHDLLVLALSLGAIEFPGDPEARVVKRGAALTAVDLVGGLADFHVDRGPASASRGVHQQREAVAVKVAKRLGPVGRIGHDSQPVPGLLVRRTGHLRVDHMTIDRTLDASVEPARPYGNGGTGQARGQKKRWSFHGVGLTEIVVEQCVAAANLPCHIAANDGKVRQERLLNRAGGVIATAKEQSHADQ